jgi:catechol 2,3-dioxygenase-like lactoylglutathione lyase family enzyme
MPEILQHHHVLAVPDVERSAQFYTDMLVFRIVAEPDGWIEDASHRRRQRAAP